jgi:hypothetical protein
MFRMVASGRSEKARFDVLSPSAIVELVPVVVIGLISLGCGPPG